jgi:hypothetical protein
MPGQPPDDPYFGALHFLGYPVSALPPGMTALELALPYIPQLLRGPVPALSPTPLLEGAVHIHGGDGRWYFTRPAFVHESGLPEATHRSRAASWVESDLLTRSREASAAGGRNDLRSLRVDLETLGLSPGACLTRVDRHFTGLLNPSIRHNLHATPEQAEEAVMALLQVVGEPLPAHRAALWQGDGTFLFHTKVAKNFDFHFAANTGGNIIVQGEPPVGFDRCLREIGIHPLFPDTEQFLPVSAYEMRKRARDLEIEQRQIDRASDIAAEQMAL